MASQPGWLTVPGNTRWVVVFAALVGLLILTWSPSGDGMTGGAPPAPLRGPLRIIDSPETTAVLTRSAERSLHFVPNAGQTDDVVRFIVRGSGHTIFFTPDEVVFGAVHQVEGEYAGSVVRLRFGGASPSPTVEGLDRIPASVNYFKGNDPSKWRTNVPTYAGVAYEDLYPGIDLMYRGVDGHLKSEFVVAPGASPDAIRLVYTGVESMRVRVDGALVLKTELGELVEAKPDVYQKIGGRRVEVQGAHALLGEGQVGFEVAAYDKAHPLVIDPVLEYATYLGGSERDRASAIAADASGNAYVTGYTVSPDFPTVAPVDASCIASPGFCSRDAFVTKFGPAGALVYSTYLGGITGSEQGRGIAVDGSGNAYVTGETGSTDLPTKNPHQASYGGSSDAFVTKLNPQGLLVYSTYLGGTAFDQARGIAVDAAGRAYVAGSTDSTDFPSLDPWQAACKLDQSSRCRDAFVAEYDLNGAIVYSTFLGGSGRDSGLGVGVDASGNVYVAGETKSTDFPTLNAYQASIASSQDAFVAKLDAAGTLVYSTYLGGSTLGGLDRLGGIAVDAPGDAYVTGYTFSTDFPMRDAWQAAHGGGTSDAFVARFGPTGSLVYSTYLGGNDIDQGEAIAVDAPGKVYVAGATRATDFPTADPLQAAKAGESDAFVAKFDSGGSLVFSTYLGGSVGSSGDTSPSSVDTGFGIAVDTSGNAYVAGETWAADFPTANAAQAGYDASGDGFVVKIRGPIIVNSKDDVDDSKCDLTHCSLREAINRANQGPGLDMIQFEIAVNASESSTRPVITPAAVLPSIVDRVVVDGSTQPGAGVVQIDGLAVVGDVQSGPGLVIESSSSTITGLWVTGFPGSGIVLAGNGNEVKNNSITRNGGAGVTVKSGTGNTIRSNSIWLNEGLGIDLGGDGVTANDEFDPDAGPNNLQNFEVGRK